MSSSSPAQVGDYRAAAPLERRVQANREIDLKRENAIGYVTLNRPAKLNAFAGTMREDLLACLKLLCVDPQVRVIVLRGAGRAFCAGGDVRYMRELRDRNDVVDFARILDAANAVVRTLYGCQKPTLAAVHGVAAGGGANLALACDVRLGADGCSFAQSFVKIGLGPDWGGSFVLPRIVGVDRARELLLTGRTVGAEEALGLGLIHRLVPKESFDGTVRAVAEQLAAASSHAAAAIKGSLQIAGGVEAALEYERSAQIRCFLTREAHDAFSAFGRPVPPEGERR